MARIASAKRHAQAIYELALERNEVEAWRRDLKRIVEAFKDRQLMSALEMPKFSFEAKKQLIEETLPRMAVLAMNLVLFLTVKGRLHLLQNIFTEYERMVDAHLGIEHAEVMTPFPVDGRERALMAERLARLLGKKQVVIDIKVEPAIIGGLVARVGDKLIDGSTRTKLVSLKRNLQSGVSIA